ncbi:ATPase family associated with various cellular activities (AAA) [Catalinimonas alkaloidigena]|uniref:ATPase family associated with various cellular activities (AAA) n=1 Tax=Catalinimonas alkaloidigena TaxID=1075417 RepID=A0A1G9EBU5_9BACT|nr:DNA repair ATPase [Catalinimonas alkaloidigena]SDK73538.1 ATPase family associated with various cellular activities (AAA) [Catalinimonas alkaloidigena]
MAETISHTTEEAPTQLEQGTYEILRNRLKQHADDLRTRLDQLNGARRDVFGSLETKLVATERVTTEHNCVAQDMVPIGDSFLFGYNVHLGLKTETHLQDVFSIYRYQDHQFHAESLAMVQDARFLEDFKNLYKYYRDTRFVKFGVIGPQLFMVFQTSPKPEDIKTFKWAIQPDGKGVKYLDNRSDHEFVYPNQHEFRWIRATRDMHRKGMHPHISIEDRVFVEAVGGDLTIKVEDNTDTGEGIYAEPVDQVDQTLDDAEIHYAPVGNLIILKIKPFQEKAFRYIVYNEKLREAVRIDALADACVLLPDDQGILFPNGFYLQNGEYKLFDTDDTHMRFEKRLASPNGEDFLYVFYSPYSNHYTLLFYNLIEQRADIPVSCHGYSLFESGELLLFRDTAGDNAPKRHHAVQIWQTPFVGPDVPLSTTSDHYLFKIGNKDVVRAMAESRELITLVNRDDRYADLYIDLAKQASTLLDSYHWLSREEAYQLNEPLQAIKQSAAAAIEEFEKVTRLRQSTAEETHRVFQKAEELFGKVRRKKADSIRQYVEWLAELRTVRGELIALKELRYADGEAIATKEGKTAEQQDKLAHDAVQFLLQENSLAPYQQRLEELQQKADAVGKVVEVRETEQEVDTAAHELDLLIEVVSNLKIEDATQTTQIIDRISTLYAHLNQLRAALKRKRKELRGQEGRAEFAAQLKLIDQSVTNYLDASQTPERCDEYLTKLLIQLEELEGRFVEFEDFIEKITEKREELYNTFESKKVALIETRNRRAEALRQSAERVLKGIQNRVSSFASIAEINGYFAADLMVDKVRQFAQQLQELGDSVKADDVLSRLKTVREDAARQLKDRQELFVGGADTIRFGEHHFSVNTQPLDLTLVPRDGTLQFHLTGTNFFQPITDPAFLATREAWDQTLVSENARVYRAEYLAWQLFQQTQLSDDTLAEAVQQYVANHPQEGYVKGVHDQDALLLLQALRQLDQHIDLLRYPSSARAMAALYWQGFMAEKEKSVWHHRLKGIGVILQVFPDTHEFDGMIEELQTELRAFAQQHQLFAETWAEEAGAYLLHEIARDESFVTEGAAAQLRRDFAAYLKQVKAEAAYQTSVEALAASPAARFKLIRKWLRAFLDHTGKGEQRGYVDEVAVQLFANPAGEAKVIEASLETALSGLQGTHAVLDNGAYTLQYHDFSQRLRTFERETVPQYQAFVALKKQLTEDFRHELRLDSFRPRVLTSFVRNRLIDKVYLPLIGTNFAKQLGAAGDQKRTDRQGMLLLISPPGYGKTTLMEYIASRLGLVFMKINGPAIGHQVVSLDPGTAPNASAREELEKLNLALEMGDNLMLYLDDIQHLNPEFLQKFISLCDAQRKIEGVYRGRSRTYDLRGRKVAVVMAGNPYTESGDQFQIPDMLANRADIYNLGDIIGDSDEAFELSYLENSLMANPTLQKLAAKSTADLFPLLRIAATGSKEGLEFEANHTPEEINEYVNVLRKLVQVRDVLLRVNQEYIHSAAQADEYRTEPPFKLQGSYRDMNKLAEKVVPVMNDDELKTLLRSHYEQEAQTLTQGAEANLLKWKEMLGWITSEENARWEAIKTQFVKNNRLKGLGGNGVSQVVAQMEVLAEGIQRIGEALGRNGN